MKAYINISGFIPYFKIKEHKGLCNGKDIDNCIKVEVNMDDKYFSNTDFICVSEIEKKQIEDYQRELILLANKYFKNKI